MIPDIASDATAAEARSRLMSSGWSEIATGDWAWVFASPDDRLAARVTPIDPAFRLFADETLSGPRNPYLVRVDAVLPLRRKGYVTVMERLFPTDEAEAHRLAASIVVVGMSASSSPQGARNDFSNAPDIVALRGRLQAILDEGQRRFRLWGGTDLKPANILQTRDGE